MTRLELDQKAASDEVLREWLRTMYKESSPNVEITYESRKNVAKTPSSFNGSVGALVDGRLIKIEYKGKKKQGDVTKIKVEQRHISSGNDPYDISLLSSDRVAEGMLSLDFGAKGFAEIVTVSWIDRYEDYSGKRVEIGFDEESEPDARFSVTYFASMSESAFESACIEIDSKVLMVRHCAGNDYSANRIVGFAKLDQRMIELMNNGWVLPEQALAA